MKDTWKFNKDKRLHFAVGLGIAFMSALVYSLLFSNSLVIIVALVGFALGSIANGLKELYDLTGRGHASLQDYVYGTVGALVGSLIFYFIFIIQ
jgi:VanZ family protein